MARSKPSVTLSVRIPPELREQLELLSDATGRTKSYLSSEAIKHYLSIQDWQVQSIKAAVKKADKKGTKFVDHQDVVDWVNSWDTDDELDKP